LTLIWEYNIIKSYIICGESTDNCMVRLSDKIQWHPGFCRAAELELEANKYVVSKKRNEGEDLI
jgi:hypothetical protein